MAMGRLYTGIFKMSMEGKGGKMIMGLLYLILPRLLEVEGIVRTVALRVVGKSIELSLLKGLRRREERRKCV